MELADIPNLGPKSAEMLARAGIYSLEKLRQLGAVNTYLAVMSAGCNPSRNLLWALHAALSGTKWNHLSDSTKKQLLSELQTAQGSADNEEML